MEKLIEAAKIVEKRKALELEEFKKNQGHIIPLDGIDIKLPSGADKRNR